MGMEATGKIHHIGSTEHVSDRFSKRELVLELADNPKYPQFVAFQVTKDKCAMLDDYSIGDEVRVTFNLRGRGWTSPKGEVRYFNTLDVWKLDRTSKRQESKPTAPDDDPFGGTRLGDVEDIPF